MNIFGVPFTFMPHEGGEDGPPPPPATPKSRIEPLVDKQQFGIFLAEMSCALTTNIESD